MIEEFKRVYKVGDRVILSPFIDYSESCEIISIDERTFIGEFPDGTRAECIIGDSYFTNNWVRYEQD